MPAPVGDTLNHPRQVARFLADLSSPETSKAGLIRHWRFGCMDQFPFADILRLPRGRKTLTDD